jgi:hypothetical protein
MYPVAAEKGIYLLQALLDLPVQLIEWSIQAVDREWHEQTVKAPPFGIEPF